MKHVSHINYVQILQKTLKRLFLSVTKLCIFTTLKVFSTASFSRLWKKKTQSFTQNGFLIKPAQNVV